MDWFWTVLLLAIIFGLSLYWYFRNTKCYLEDLGIPFILVTFWSLAVLTFQMTFGFGLNMHKIEKENYKKYGRIYGTTESSYPVLSIAEPELLRKILVKDFPIFSGARSFISGEPVLDNFLSRLRGEKWKRVRTIISPAFSTGKIKRTTEIIINSAKVLAQNFVSKADEPIDGKKFLNSFTMDVIASTAFGIKIYSYQDPNNRFVKEAEKFFGGSFNWRIAIIVLCPKLASAMGVNVLDTKMVHFFRDTTLEIIKDRKKNRKIKNDFLQLLIDAEKEHEREENVTLDKQNSEDKIAEEMGHEEGNDNIFKPSNKYKSLSQNELLAQCLIFFLGGYDTTASTLACLFHSLAVNPDIQEKLREEVNEVIFKHNNQITYEAVQEMKYLDKVIFETLRMYPPLFRLERLADSDYELEGTGITIKKGTVVKIPVCAMHYDPEFYPKPEIFNPERFNSEEKATRHPYSFLTFGAGPRNCVGMRFALLEIKLCVAYIISVLMIKARPETEASFKLYSPMGLLKPQTIFTVQKRNTKLFDSL